MNRGQHDPPFQGEGDKTTVNPLCHELALNIFYSNIFYSNIIIIVFLNYKLPCRSCFPVVVVLNIYSLYIPSFLSVWSES